ncbi:hypothetical protein [Streptomyces sp. NPDC096012]|uniref:hypothetical protein n=1 Tax=Streptomyces sp. NPDC096012 TaxID=3155684 RepID=UPI00336A69B3
MGGQTETSSVPIPADRVDGFDEAYCARPERLLDPAARRSCPAWSLVAPDLERRSTERLRRDLDSGTGHERYGRLRGQLFLDGPLVLVRVLPRAPAGGTGSAARQRLRRHMSGHSPRATVAVAHRR